MRIVAAEGDCGEHARHDGEGPTACDHHPASTFRFRALEQDIRDDAVAQQYEHERTHKLSKALCQHLNSFPQKTPPLNPANRKICLPHVSRVCTSLPVFR